MSVAAAGSGLGADLLLVVAVGAPEGPIHFGPVRGEVLGQAHLQGRGHRRYFRLHRGEVDLLHTANSRGGARGGKGKSMPRALHSPGEAHTGGGADQSPVHCMAGVASKSRAWHS